MESDYFIDENPKNYIALFLKTNNSIEYLEILIDIFGGYYELTEGKYFDLDKFYSGFPYYLEFKAKSGDLLNIKLSFSKIKELDIDNLTLIEYKDINHKINLNSKDYPIEKNSKEINKTMTISHVIKNIETNLIIIKLYPKNKTISSFHTNITVDKNFYYYLNLDQTINLEKLNQSLYYFSIDIDKNKSVNITLDMIDKNEFIPFISVAISEVESAFSKKNLITTTTTINSNSQSIIYKAFDEMTNFLIIIFAPQIEFEQIKISYSYAKEIRTTYNLNKEGLNNIINLYPETPYYFDISAFKDYFLKTLYISFTLDNCRLNPFNGLYLYENLNKTNNSYDKAEAIFISMNRNEYQFKGNITYTFYNISTSTITLYIVPNHFIKSINFKIDFGGETYKLKDGSSSKYNGLSSNFRYFFAIDVNKNINKNATFTLKSKNKYSTFPFMFPYVYEISNKIIKDKSVKSIPVLKGDEELDFEIFHKINFNETDELMLEIRPKFNLEYIEIGVKLDYSKKDYFTLILVLSIVGGLLIIAGVIIIIIVVKKKKKASASIDIPSGNNKSADLLPEED